MLDRFFVFIYRNDVWILFLCALGIVWYLIQLASRQREYRRSSFLLERERAAADRNASLLMIVLFVGVVGGIIYINTSIVPTLSADLFDPPTPQPDLLATALAAPAVPAITPRPEIPTATPPLAPTATLRNPGSVPGGIPQTPTTPAIVVEALETGCGPDIAINEPASGTTVSGGISLFGRATASDFNYYKIEINGPFTNDLWVSLLDGVVNAPVENGFLGSAALTGWTDGVYQIRVTIIDTESNEAGSCLIQIGINN
jgi:hypothetical protein